MLTSTNDSKVRLHTAGSSFHGLFLLEPALMQVHTFQKRQLSGLWENMTGLTMRTVHGSNNRGCEQSKCHQ